MKKILVIGLLFIMHLAHASVRCPTSSQLAAIEHYDFQPSDNDWTLSTSDIPFEDFRGRTFSWQFIISLPDFSGNLDHDIELANQAFRNTASSYTYARLNSKSQYECRYRVVNGPGNIIAIMNIPGLLLP